MPARRERQNPPVRGGVSIVMPRPPIALLLSGAAALLGCCSPPPVGYQGPLPSIAARRTLDALTGRTLPAGSVAFCPRELVVHGFLVMPNMPALVVDDPAAAPGTKGRYWIPLLQDGDIADLHHRITGAVPAGMPRGTSDAYRRMVDGA